MKYLVSVSVLGGGWCGTVGLEGVVALNVTAVLYSRGTGNKLDVTRLSLLSRVGSEPRHSTLRHTRTDVEVSRLDRSRGLESPGPDFKISYDNLMIILR